MGFQRFVRAGRSYKPLVSITRQGLISFNAAAYMRYPIRDYKYAVLFFDLEERRIGIMLTNTDGEAGAVHVRHRGAGADISARRFLEYYSIEYGDKSHRFQPEMIDAEGGPMVVMELDNPQRARV
jgi:hypothetical protein